jgi:hypothetical protein
MKSFFFSFWFIIVGAQWEDPGLIIKIPTKHLDIDPFDITCKASEVSPEASRGAARTKVL